MTNQISFTFDQPDLVEHLAMLDEVGLDQLDFGVIGFDNETLVQRYNECESKSAGIKSDRMLGQPIFTVVAPCMNNYLVAQRFEDAFETGAALDATINYVLTLRMRPVKVLLRLLAAPGAAIRYVLVCRSA
jgi:photoactive yellow protein